MRILDQKEPNVYNAQIRFKTAKLIRTLRMCTLDKHDAIKMEEPSLASDLTVYHQTVIEVEWIIHMHKKRYYNAFKLLIAIILRF